MRKTMGKMMGDGKDDGKDVSKFLKFMHATDSILNQYDIPLEE